MRLKKETQTCKLIHFIVHIQTYNSFMSSSHRTLGGGHNINLLYFNYLIDELSLSILSPICFMKL